MPLRTILKSYKHFNQAIDDLNKRADNIACFLFAL